MKQKEFTRSEAMQRLTLFLKLRKGKGITEKTIKDFEKLINGMWSNFKSHESIAISQYIEDDYTHRSDALKSIRNRFIQFENGGNAKLSDIQNFSYYKDKTYKAKINDELVVISKNDFAILQYIFFGEKS
jgi:hypothetical protein